MEAIGERLRGARLYFVCDALDASARLRALLEAATSGGTDVLQLRDKEVEDEALLEAARVFADVAAAAGVPFILNDRPDLVDAAGADGVHVGQGDTPVASAREAMPPGAIAGLSTHAPDQLALACSAQGPSRPDYVSAGPVWETPTKPGREAAGLAYVAHAAAHATLPWFAIGGIDPGNVAEVVTAGARRVVVVRAIRDADDPAATAAALRGALTGREVGTRG